MQIRFLELINSHARPIPIRTWSRLKSCSSASKQVTLVTVPGGEGDYGVLAGHAPLITTVRPGVIEAFTDENSAASDRIFVAGGFAEVTNERCTVLAEEATPVSELNRAQSWNTTPRTLPRISALPKPTPNAMRWKRA